MMTYYDVLGVSKEASNNEIKRAYKKLVKKYHPDVFDGDKNTANEKIKELNEAYETLSNAELKKSYDEVLFAPPTTDIDFSDSLDYSNNTSSDFSSNQKYEDLYRYDYYKKYTTNYYGISREDLKIKKDTDSKKNTNYTYKNSSFSKLKLAIVFCVIAIAFIILLIYLLSYVKMLLKNTSNDNTNTSIEQLPFVNFGMSYDFIESRIGTPDFTEYKSGNLYAYWEDSYIIFNKYNYVIGWHNYGGFFLTETVTGEDFTTLQEFYNMLQTEFY